MKSFMLFLLIAAVLLADGALFVAVDVEHWTRLDLVMLVVANGLIGSGLLDIADAMAKKVEARRG